MNLSKELQKDGKTGRSIIIAQAKNSPTSVAQMKIPTLHAVRRDSNNTGSRCFVGITLLSMTLDKVMKWSMEAVRCITDGNVALETLFLIHTTAR